MYMPAQKPFDPEEVQYALWRKMTATEAVRHTSELAMFCLELARLSHEKRFSKISHKNRKTA